MWKIYLSSSLPLLNIGFYICKKCEKEEEKFMENMVNQQHKFNFAIF
jgi:hypothetical protein